MESSPVHVRGFDLIMRVDVYVSSLDLLSFYYNLSRIEEEGCSGIQLQNSFSRREFGVAALGM